MTIDTSKFKFSTKALIVGFISLGGLATIPAVNAPLTAFLEAHHGLAPLVSALIAVYTVLHNPVVEDALGIRKAMEDRTAAIEAAKKNSSGAL